MGSVVNGLSVLLSRVREGVTFGNTTLWRWGSLLLYYGEFEGLLPSLGGVHAASGPSMAGHPRGYIGTISLVLLSLSTHSILRSSKDSSDPRETNEMPLFRRVMKTLLREVWQGCPPGYRVESMNGLSRWVGWHVLWRCLHLSTVNSVNSVLLY